MSSGVRVCSRRGVGVLLVVSVVAAVGILTIGVVLAVSSVLGASSIGGVMAETGAASQVGPLGARAAVAALQVDVASTGVVIVSAAGVCWSRARGEVVRRRHGTGVLVGEHVSVAGNVAAETVVVDVAGVEGAVAASGSGALVLLSGGRSGILLAQTAGEARARAFHFRSPFDRVETVVEASGGAELPLANESPDGGSTANA